MEKENLCNQEDSDLVSKYAEIFRSKIISDFHLLEHINEEAKKVEAPCYYTGDITDQESFSQIMAKNKDGLVRFQPSYVIKSVPQMLRRKNRVIAKNSKWPPFDLWAHIVVKSKYFQNFILTMILINGVVLGTQAELADRDIPKLEPLKVVMDVFDYFSLLVFVVEILLKWTDQFWLFWENRWNIFDFVVTVLTLIPELMSLWYFVFAGSSSDSESSKTSSDVAVVANNLRIFRILRSLKMVSRFTNVRIIVLAVTKAFQAMLFITILLFIFAYIFAVMGVVFFRQSYKSASQDNLYFANSFSSMSDALITLIQLFTLDHWFQVYKDLTSVSDYFFAALYVLLWILIGSFVFKNIFVGIMVNNFQNIRNELYKEMEKVLEAERREKEMIQFAGELEKQMKRKASEGSIHCTSGLKIEADDQIKSNTLLRRQSSRFKSTLDVKEALSVHVMKTEKDSLEWQTMVEKNLENLARDETCFCWPKDSLFQYFLIMEALMENLHERKELLSLMVEALLQIHDN